MRETYQISFLGPFEQGYQGVWTVPGDSHWRVCTYSDGEIIYFEEARHAEANAAHRLCAYLNQKGR